MLKEVGRWFAGRAYRDINLAGLPHISLRAMTKGGPLAASARFTPTYLLLDRNDLILLVHGYNNDQQQAFESYKRFLENLGCSWGEWAAALYWPGDSRASTAGKGLNWLSPIASLVSYPWQPDRAREAAEKMSEALDQALKARKAVAGLRGRTASKLSLYIVAHSMGCRLTLEFLNRLAFGLQFSPIRIRLVVLMAAAVPLYYVQEGGALGKALTLSESTHVYWSTKDKTLRRWFPMGQILERPFPRGWHRRTRDALGRCGFTSSDRLKVHARALDHEGYWPDVEIASDIRSELDAIHKPGITRRLITPASPKPRRPSQRRIAA